MNELTTTNPADTFRAKASDRITSAAGMSLHDLVDEFQRLTGVMDANLVENDRGSVTLNDIGEVAKRERGVISGASRARFGLTLMAYDRPSVDCDHDW